MDKQLRLNLAIELDFRSKRQSSDYAELMLVASRLLGRDDDENAHGIIGLQHGPPNGDETERAEQAWIVVVDCGKQPMTFHIDIDLTELSRRLPEEQHPAFWQAVTTAYGEFLASETVNDERDRVAFFVERLQARLSSLVYLGDR